ncbi:thermonuclease family protein [Denitromonas sp.]|uniref:thermonuclease family protein n=1 Tax=Denitromonas sp. TaxID=2734609 RepID=UPI003A85DFF2
MILRLLSLTCLLLLTTVVAAASISCRVVGISDGDTLTCLTSEKRQIKVRLAQIDAPEKDQAFGSRSKRALSDLVFGKEVKLETVSTDKYGRTVAQVRSDGRDVNFEMVASGMAWVYDKYAHDPTYYAAQTKAKADRVGLWDDPNAIRPSDWRHGGAKAVVVASMSEHTAPAQRDGFVCGTKRFCKQMASCAEARFHLTQCGLSKLDRDRDGVPCESLCGGR